MSKKFTGMWPTPRSEMGGTSIPKDGKDKGYLEKAIVNRTEQPAPPASNQLTLLPGDSLASLTVLPGSSLARKMTATSGLNISGLLKNSDPATSLVRTFLESSPPISTRCYLTWRVKATPARRLIFQLAVSMPRTDESGSSLWPTPRANKVGGYSSPEFSPTLEQKVKMWPTPTEHGLHNRKGVSKHSGDGLSTAVKMYPTPQARDWKGKSQRGSTEGNRDCLPNVAGGQLNPMWVEWLMGFPEGWTEV